ncbi:phosphonate ABC transporter, permease protein PhnE [Salipaludibacillus neizhouensis]|uniref:Phosphonate ABC transporter, permease protein PhnE n=1 Tax=Salipaludibacillus neizhouensis TaxID=885475 RepID=A0A3A9KDS5_9BACI|nr:phosphonate ABC transporter, permease protein PhnE [Salipaludibacillus neizhouensis]RKL67793.1 phosphonate ABC transporter, permease protein PhnE [Salipaludibacillus neizhouensis]
MPNSENINPTPRKRHPVTPKGLKWSLGTSLLIVIVLYILSVYQTTAFPNRVVDGFPIIFNFVVDDLWPPNWSYFDRVAMSLLETWNMALFSSTFAALIALPMSFLAASNINRNAYFYQFIRNFLNLLRTIPEIILAVLFVAVVGIGAVSGILALTVFSIGILAKLISETVEAVDPGPLEAIRASGGNVFQVISFGVMPQILPQYASYSLYVLEINVKASVVLGFVGAGGIGLILNQQLSLFNYDNVSTIIIVLFLTITIIDLISNRLRGRLE